MEDIITTKLAESSIARALGEHYTKMGDHKSAAECFAEACEQLTVVNGLINKRMLEHNESNTNDPS